MEHKDSKQSSRDAYDAIVNNGLLGKASLEIYSILFKHGPLTAGEVFARCKARDVGHTLVKGAVSARMTELRRQGVITPAGRKTCSYTGSYVVAYKTTGRLPVGNGRLEEPIYVKLERLEQNIDHLETENMHLKMEIERLREDARNQQLSFETSVSSESGNLSPEANTD